MNNSEYIAAQGDEGGEVGIVAYSDFHCEEPLDFALGGRLDSFNIRYETYGALNEEKSNAILVCHALSGDHHCAGVYSLSDKKQGWWNNIIGPKKPLDTTKYFIIGSNCIGGCLGSTGPSSVNPKTGKRFNLSFPIVTIKDMVVAQKKLVEHLGIKRLLMVIGGSMGGMQALQWAVDYPDAVQKIIGLATTPYQNAQAIAFNEVGRSAIMRDPLWLNGDYDHDKVPADGLSTARMMAHITYLSNVGLDAKFGRRFRNEELAGSARFKPNFEIENYLHYQGKSFVNRFDANTYLYFTKALDLFDLRGEDGTLEEGFEKVRCPVMTVGFTSDWLFPPAQNKAIINALIRLKKNAVYAEVKSDLGHDSFLTDSPKLYELIRNFLDARRD